VETIRAPFLGRAVREAAAAGGARGDGGPILSGRRSAAQEDHRRRLDRFRPSFKNQFL
jgi:hypothetical protein